LYPSHPGRPFNRRQAAQQPLGTPSGSTGESLLVGTGVPQSLKGLRSGRGVTVNDLGDDLQLSHALQAGANVTLTNGSNNTLIISASAGSLVDIGPVDLPIPSYIIQRRDGFENPAPPFE